MSRVESFGDQIFQYILNRYGTQTLSKIQSEKNKSIVTKVVQSSCNQNDSVEHAANKVVAMLRMNP